MAKYILLLFCAVIIAACGTSTDLSLVDNTVTDEDSASEPDETVDNVHDTVIDDADTQDTDNDLSDDLSDEVLTEAEVADTEADEKPDEDSALNVQCTYLFGRPNEKTGLTWDQCKDSFNCEGVNFIAPLYNDSDLLALNSKIHMNPLPVLTSDPYENQSLYPEEPGKVCGLIWDKINKDAYTLETYDSVEAAELAKARITHGGACGHCSSLQSLAVYIYQTDLATPVKQCTYDSIIHGDDYLMECLQKLGFDGNCAKIWMYNGKHTKKVCMTTCLTLQNAPYHNQDGSLNNCIQCDEDKSGPVFRAVSGRTRRNSGLPTALCRPCNTISTIDHHY